MSILIIKVCGVEGEGKECEIIETQASLYGLEATTIAPKNKEELEAELSKDKSYDYIYVSSHGDDEGLCNHDSSIKLSWIEFGLMLCENGTMAKDSILMLSCCRGGLNQVAYDLFNSCPDISYVVGPRSILEPEEMQICYSLLLYLTVRKEIDPVVACDKIRSATDIRFFFSDRLEAEVEPAYLARTEYNVPRFEALWDKMEPEEVTRLKEELKLETAPEQVVKEDMKKEAVMTEIAAQK